MDPRADYYIQKLQLKKHPEGGYYNEIYRSAEMIYTEALPERYGSSRNFTTSIYFLLKGKDKSLFHRLKSDEIWHYYDGSPAKIYLLDESGNLSEITIGKNLDSGEVLQAVIQRGNWFAAELTDKKSFILTGCSVSPGFEFSDFELAVRKDLLEKYPRHEKLIRKFTRT